MSAAERDQARMHRSRYNASEPQSLIDQRVRPSGNCYLDLCMPRLIPLGAGHTYRAASTIERGDMRHFLGNQRPCDAARAVDVTRIFTRAEFLHA